MFALQLPIFSHATEIALADSQIFAPLEEKINKCIFVNGDDIDLLSPAASFLRMEPTQRLDVTPSSCTHFSWKTDKEIDTNVHCCGNFLSKRFFFCLSIAAHK